MDEQRVQQLVKEYRAGEITRRQFINRATVILGGAALANALLIAANGGSIPQVAAAMGQTMAPTGAATMAGTAAAMDIETSTVEFKVDDVTAPGYMARPKGAGPFPGVVVIQEWWGVDDHIKNVTERFARAGFVALAPDLYHGQVAKEPSDAQKLVATVMLDQAVKEIQGAVNHLVAQDFVSPKQTGVVGFCFGGRLSFMMSWMGNNVGAVAVFYGGGLNPTDADLQKIDVPVIGFWGEADQGIPVANVKQWEAKLKEFGKVNEMHLYPGAGHAFLNDTRPSFNKEAAEDAWKRTVDWFKKYLVEGAGAGAATPGATPAATASS